MSDDPLSLGKTPVDLRDLKSLLAQVDREQPDPAAVRELQHYLDTIPDLWRSFGDLAKIARDTAIDAWVSVCG